MAEADLYTSPIVYSYLLKNAAKIPHDRSKSDVFSFGLCLLEAGLLRDVQDIYDEDQNWVNTDLLVSLIDEFCLRQFNTNLSDLLRKCLMTEESSRPDWLVLKKMFAGDTFVNETYGTNEGAQHGHQNGTPVSFCNIKPNSTRARLRTTNNRSEPSRLSEKATPRRQEALWHTTWAITQAHPRTRTAIEPMTKVSRLTAQTHCKAKLGFQPTTRTIPLAGPACQILSR
jgi:hypothetical protein